MNMNIENFKEEHFALYQIWHRGATTYIPNAQILSLINLHFMECTTKKITLFWKFIYGAQYAKYSIWESI